VEDAKFYAGGCGSVSDQMFLMDLLQAVVDIAGKHKRTVGDTKKALKILRKQFDDVVCVGVKQYIYFNGEEYAAIPKDDCSDKKGNGIAIPKGGSSGKGRKDIAIPKGGSSGEKGKDIVMPRDNSSGGDGK